MTKENEHRDTDDIRIYKLLMSKSDKDYEQPGSMAPVFDLGVDQMNNLKYIVEEIDKKLHFVSHLLTQVQPKTRGNIGIRFVKNHTTQTRTPTFVKYENIVEIKKSSYTSSSLTPARIEVLRKSKGIWTAIELKAEIVLNSQESAGRHKINYSLTRQLIKCGIDLLKVRNVALKVERDFRRAAGQVNHNFKNSLLMDDRIKQNISDIVIIIDKNIEEASRKRQ